MSAAAGDGGGIMRSQVAKVALIAACATAAGFAAIHFVRGRRSNPTEKDKKCNGSAANSAKHNFMKLKEEGNRLFLQKRYVEAIKVFSEIINAEENAPKDLVAVAFQNRAACKQLCGNCPEEDAVADCTAAIRLKRDYARAYARRARLQRRLAPQKALVDVMAAVHLDGKFEDTLKDIVGEIITSVMQQKPSVVEATEPLPITHNQVYTWLAKSFEDEVITKRYYACLAARKWETKLELALKAISEVQFERALELAAEEESSTAQAAEAALLSARLRLFQGLTGQYEEELKRFDALLSGGEVLLEDEERELRKSALLLRIHAASDLDELKALVEEGVTSFGSSPDLFMAAAISCLQRGVESMDAGLDFLNDKRCQATTRTRILSFVASFRQMLENPSMYTLMPRFEQLVTALPDDDIDRDWARLALATAYTLFGQIDGANELISALIAKKTPWCIYHTIKLQLELQQGHMEEARAIAADILRLEPGNAEAIASVRSVDMHADGNTLKPHFVYDAWLAEVTPLLTRSRGTPEHPFQPELAYLAMFLRARREAALALEIQ